MAREEYENCAISIAFIGDFVGITSSDTLRKCNRNDRVRGASVMQFVNNQRKNVHAFPLRNPRIINNYCLGPRERIGAERVIVNNYDISLHQ